MSTSGGSAATAEAPTSNQPNVTAPSSIKIEQKDELNNQNQENLVEAGEFGNPRMLFNNTNYS